MEPDSLTYTSAHVSLGAVVHNARTLAALAAPARLMAVVKADAYGHGAGPVARVLEADGVAAFAVATLPEALALRAAGVASQILVFGLPVLAALDAYRAYGLELTVPTLASARALAEAARPDAPLRVHVKVDTGMHRLGLDAPDVPEALRLLARPGLELAGLWTHLATSGDGFAREQAARLAAFDGLAPNVPRHVANSGAVLSGAGRLPADALVRSGIALYGLSPTNDAAPLARHGLRPAMRFTSRVIQLRTVAAGETVSYGRTWTAPAATRIATVAAGYADGVPRALSNRGEVGVGGQRYPIAGVVCMDLLMLDLGAPNGPGAAVREGDEAVLFGPGGPAAEEVAAWAETIAYEIATRVSARVPRVYGEA